MFRCGKCGRITEPGEKLTKMPVLMREKVYQTEKIKKNNKKEIITSFGNEIIKELNLCENCAKKEGLING